MTTTTQSILDGIQKAMLLRAESTVGRPLPTALAVDAAGKPVFRTVRDRLGDIMRVYRASPIPNRHRPKYSGADLRAIRAERGVGRPLSVTTAPTFASAVKLWGSQRAAAKALGLNLSTFQRRLAKEAA